MITKGVQSIFKGDKKTEMKISRTILEKLSSNTQFSVPQYSEADLQAIMNEQAAIEIATDKIRNSKIDFGQGTKKTEIDNLILEMKYFNRKN